MQTPSWPTGKENTDVTEVPPLHTSAVFKDDRLVVIYNIRKKVALTEVLGNFTHIHNHDLMDSELRNVEVPPNVLI
jgi:hypothetical protein